MVTIGNYTESTIQSINEGKVVKEKGGIAFGSKEEAQEWGNNHLGHGNYQIFPLCPNCEENSFIDTPTLKYPTMKKLIKPVKMLPNNG